MKIDSIVRNHVAEIRKNQDKFVLDVIKKHCNVFQRIWFSVCMKMKWRVRFVEVVTHTSDVFEIPFDLHGHNAYSVRFTFGVRVNGKTHWMTNEN